MTYFRRYVSVFCRVLALGGILSLILTALSFCSDITYHWYHYQRTGLVHYSDPQIDAERSSGQISGQDTPHDVDPENIYVNAQDSWLEIEHGGLAFDRRIDWKEVFSDYPMDSSDYVISYQPVGWGYHYPYLSAFFSHSTVSVFKRWGFQVLTETGEKGTLNGMDWPEKVSQTGITVPLPLGILLVFPFLCLCLAKRGRGVNLGDTQLPLVRQVSL